MASKPRAANWRPQRTLIDLYTARDHTRWYWRLAGFLSAFMIMIGFLLFPAAFPNAPNTRISQNSICIIALTLLAFGFSLSVTLWFICTNWLFQFDILFIPCFSSCLLGFLDTIISISIHPSPTPWDFSSVVALVLSLISSIAYAALALLTYRKISIVRVRDITFRRRTDSESIKIPEDELQRQQLLRLLIGSDKASPDASQSTYKIAIPNSLGHESRSNTLELLHPPTAYDAYEGRGRSRSLSNIEAENVSLLGRGSAQDLQPDPRRETLNRSRERSVEGPPVITNTRTPLYPTPDANTPVSERHPLERNGYIRGIQSKDFVDQAGVYRPEDMDPGQERSLSRESRRAEYELEAKNRARELGRAEVEGLEVQPRIMRVQTDGWPDGGTR